MALCNHWWERLLARCGWEIDHHSRVHGIVSWMRPHPNDVASYSTRQALWITCTGRARRGGWNAGWALWREGR